MNDIDWSTEDMQMMIETACMTDEEYFDKLYTGIDEQVAAKKGRPAAKYINPLWTLELDEEDWEDIDDICSGVVAVLDRERGHKGNAIKVYKLVKLFKDYEFLTTEHIMNLCRIQKAQAGVYVFAYKLALPFVLRWMHQSGAVHRLH